MGLFDKLRKKKDESEKKPEMESSTPAVSLHEPVDQHGRTELQRCALGGDLAGMTRLISLGANVNHADYGDRTALHLAAAKGNVDGIELLLEAGADINARDEGGATPLSLAVEQHQAVAVNCLIRHGADLNLKRTNGMTPLMLVWNGNTQIAKALLEAGASVNEKDDNGMTALAYAKKYCPNPEIAALLLASGASES